MLLLLNGCNAGPVIPDAGTPCDCDHAGATWLEGGDVPAEICTPQCTPSNLGKEVNGAPWCRLDDGGFDAAFVCYGPACCTWEPPVAP